MIYLGSRDVHPLRAFVMPRAAALNDRATGFFPCTAHLQGGALMGRDDCAARWQAEADRLRTYRRQRATVHCDETRPLDEIVRDAGFLDNSIRLTAELLAAIEDEHNAHTAGTWEHAHRALVSA